MINTPPILIFDRDGTLIRDTGYISNPADVHVTPFLPELIMGISKLPIKIGVISNQSGVGRGYFSKLSAEEVHLRFVSLYSTYGITFDFIKYCFHEPNFTCLCRKPKTGLVRNSAHNYLSHAKSIYVVGDKLTDEEFAVNLGGEFFLVQPTTTESDLIELGQNIVKWVSNVTK
jgi:histidinol-phosphate phosphatase family protein